jgi:hypothetical protein
MKKQKKGKQKKGTGYFFRIDCPRIEAVLFISEAEKRDSFPYFQEKLPVSLFFRQVSLSERIEKVACPPF